MRGIGWKKFLYGGVAALLTGTLQAAVLSPIAATGWDQDVVIATSENYTTGTSVQMDGGAGDGRTAFYEQGRNPGALTTGLPTGLTESENTSGLFFQLQSFTANNVLWRGGTLTLVTAAAYESIALIGATGNGTANLTVRLSYATGEDQVIGIGSSGIAQDWFNGGSVAYTANGRQSTLSGAYQYVNEGNPRLYETILATDSSRLLESITITDSASYADGGNAIMGLSGAPAAAVPEPAGIALMTTALCLLFGVRRIRVKTHLTG